MAKKSKYKTKECKLVGAHIPLPIFDYLNIYLMFYNQSKTNLIRDLLINWIEKKREKIPRALLIAQIIEREQELWNFEKIKNLAFSTYIEKITIRLTKKGINPQIIQEIINQIEQ